MGTMTGGRIRLKRPLAGGISSLGLNDPTFSDLAGVLTGAKPVTYTDCLPEDLPALRELCRKVGLSLLLPEELLGKRENHFIQAKKMVLIGKDTKDVKAAAAAWADPRGKERWARLLGYPACCVREYTKWSVNKGKVKRMPDLVKRILRNTRRPARLDFRLNNVWNYFSRMDFDSPGDLADYRKFMDFNRELELPSRHIISWHPCSYDCPKSAKKAGAIFSFMKHHAPDYAARLEELLAKPALYLDKFRYVFFDGRVSGNSIRCKKPVSPRSLLDEKIYGLVSRCDNIKVGKEKVEFLREGKVLFSSGAFKPVILNFSKPAGRLAPTP